MFKNRSPETPSILKVFLYSRMIKHCWKFQNLWTDKYMCLFHKNTNRLIRKLSDSSIAMCIVILQKNIREQKWKILMLRALLWLLSNVFFKVTHHCWIWSKIKPEILCEPKVEFTQMTLHSALHIVNNKITIETTLVVLILAAHSDHLGSFLKIAQAHAHSHQLKKKISSEGVNTSSQNTQSRSWFFPLLLISHRFLPLLILFPTSPSLPKFYPTVISTQFSPRGEKNFAQHPSYFN